MLFALLLRILGWLFVIRVKTSARFRAQITRHTVIEIRAGERVLQQFLFADRQVKRMTGPVEKADAALVFDTAALGLRCFLSPHLLQLLFDGLQSRRIGIEGNLYLLLWFQGMAQQVFPLAPVPELSHRPPDAYIRHSPGPAVAKRLIREPVAHALDPEWAEAHVTKEKMLMMKVAAGQKPPLF